MSRRNDIELIPTVKMEKTIIIPLEEYKQLLITKGRYEEMKEFDKIYIAKYYKAIENWQICKDLKIKNDELEIVVKELKEIGLYEIYRNMSDYEWETLERKSDLYILKKYCPQIPGYYSRIFNKVIDVFKEELVTDYKY